MLLAGFEPAYENPNQLSELPEATSTMGKLGNNAPENKFLEHVFETFLQHL